MSQFAQENPCVPIKVDAFVLNPAVADDPDIRIAPITQPNYTFLRLSNSVIQNDILDPVDLHYATPSTNNSRVTDLGSGNVLQNRMGVYVSWTLPRVYRTGIAGTQASNTEAGRDQRGFSKISGTPDYSAADFRPVPTRWLVVRHLDLTTAVPQITDAKVAAAVQCRAWVITSDEFRSLEQLDDTVDLQVDVSPFIAGSTTKTDTQTLMKQAEVFIGRKWDALDWSEDQVKETVPITVLNSSNHLFSDFQLHNSSVFSMLDDFSYTDETGKRAAFTSATASYVVIGWHANAGDDPFYMQPPSQKNQPDTGDVAPETQGGRINSLNMVMSGDTSDRQVSSFLQETKSARMVCHGSIYQVEWDATKAPPSTAKKASQNLATNQPIAVGGTAIDTVLAHAHTHQNDPSGADATSKVEADIWALRALLRAQDAGPDGAQEAQDELNAHNYDRADGGALWHLSGASGDQKIVPSDDIKKQLRLLNDTQYVLDNLYRTRTQVQWELFSMWWKYVSDENPDAAITASAMKTTALRLQTLQNGSAGSPYSIPYYENQVVQTRNTISKMSDGSITTIKGAVDPFSQRKDPAFLTAGLQSGFPEDFTEQLKIRVASQVIPGDPSKSLTWNALATVVASVVPKLPGGADQGNIQDVTRALLSEFFVLSGSQDTPQPPATAVYPLYHDHGPSTDPTPDPESPMRDQWGGQQPWLPLFVEWQAEYFHIPWSEWEMASHSDGGPNHTWEYSLKATGFDPLWKQNITDTRTLSGRVLILPQPSSSLYNAVSRLFQTRLADVQAAIPDEKERDGLLARIRKLALLSSPLAGLTSHLITLVQGTHIKPAQRPPGSVVATTDAAMDTLKDLIPLGVPADVLGLIGTQTANTPYGNLARVTRIGRNPIFKPVTHGQFKFTQLNVIDKFGQAICALDPDPVPPGQEPTFPPILARGYQPQEWTDQQQPGAKSLPNVVEQDKKDPQTCNFVQLRPSINQFSRLNASFSVPDETPVSSTPNAYWRPADEYDNPIWGWVIINHADYGLQFFAADGKFYREVRLGGPTGASPSSPWKPFGPPAPETENTGLLDDLLAVFVAQPSYLLQFYKMIELSLGSTATTPNFYAGNLNAVLGPPLALVTFGLSLELALDALTTQSGFDGPSANDPPTWTLLPSEPGSKNVQYQFPVKIGDEERVYDGLVGFWYASSTEAGKMDWSNLYSYYAPPLPVPAPSPPTTAMTAQTTQIGSDARLSIPLLPASFIPPDTTVTTTSPTPTTTFTISPVPTIIASRNFQRHIFSALVDPFSTTHIYTGGLLPISSTLKLPDSVIEDALNKMTAFFRVGPVLVTPDMDVPAGYVPANRAAAPGEGGQLNAAKVGVPGFGGARGQWSWVQPYYVPPVPAPAPSAGAGTATVGGSDGEGASGGSGASTVGPPDQYTEFMGMQVGKIDATARYLAGPYTALEGYLQLGEPLLAAEGVKPVQPPA